MVYSSYILEIATQTILSYRQTQAATERGNSCGPAPPVDNHAPYRRQTRAIGAVEADADTGPFRRTSQLSKGMGLAIGHGANR
jgi:hypothetical protein